MSSKKQKKKIKQLEDRMVKLSKSNMLMLKELDKSMTIIKKETDYLFDLFDWGVEDSVNLDNIFNESLDYVKKR